MCWSQENCATPPSSLAIHVSLPYPIHSCYHFTIISCETYYFAIPLFAWWFISDCTKKVSGLCHGSFPRPTVLTMHQRILKVGYLTGSQTSLFVSLNGQTRQKVLWELRGWYWSKVITTRIQEHLIACNKLSSIFNWDRVHVWLWWMEFSSL